MLLSSRTLTNLGGLTRVCPVGVSGRLPPADLHRAALSALLQSPHIAFSQCWKRGRTQSVIVLRWTQGTGKMLSHTCSRASHRSTGLRGCLNRTSVLSCCTALVPVLPTVGWGRKIASCPGLAGLQSKSLTPKKKTREKSKARH